VSRIDPDLDQARLRVEERRALLPLAPADRVGQVQEQIATAEADQPPAAGPAGP
jgi:hypothetical protein